MKEIVPISWSQRWLLAGWIFAGAAAYPLSFALADAPAGGATLALAIEAAAALAWVIFGCILLAVTKCQPSVWVWVDVCLRIMSAGIAIKAVTVVLNLWPLTGWCRPPVDPTMLTQLHLAVLAAANLAMASVFIRWAARCRLSPFLAVFLWLVVLHGTFLWFVNRFLPIGSLATCALL